MILSDKSIHELCAVPQQVFDKALHDRLWAERGQVVPAHSGAAETMRKELLKAAIRPVTQEERDAFVPMISPFDSTLIRGVLSGVDHGPNGDGTNTYTFMPMRKIISRGLTSFGYDVSLAADGVKLFTNINSSVIDPKRLDDKCLVDAVIQQDIPDGDKYFILPPNSYALGATVEYLRIPRDIMVVCLGKSTYARAGAIINVTPIEPGFEGNVVIEISNATSLPMRIYLEEGISQFLFFRGDKPCGVSYADRGGKYQGQTGVTLPKV